MSEPLDPEWSLETPLVRAGRTGGAEHGAVNPPIQRGSTVLLPSTSQLYGDHRTYGLDGFGVHDALRDALADMTGAAVAALTPSGLAACTTALLAFVEQGGEVLMTDAVYGPTRRFCQGMLKRLGVTTIYYDPRIGANISDLITPQTHAIFLESPGSLTLEVQDTPAIAATARARNIITIIDDTWSAGVNFNPFTHGVDISVQALTKYQGGHADVLLGEVLARTPALLARVQRVIKELGLGCGSAEDAYLTLRGMRTMSLRLERQAASALEVAQWLSAQPQVARVLHPGLPSHPDHELFRRDFKRASGVFSLELKPAPEDRVAAMVEGMKLFGLGFSWGGYESLIVPCTEQKIRTIAHGDPDLPLLRLSIGLESPKDLIADLSAGLARLAG